MVVVAVAVVVALAASCCKHLWAMVTPMALRILVGVLRVDWIVEARVKING